jgi:hypothetical protein
MIIPPERVQACTDKTIAYLHEVYLMMVHGEVDRLQPDPFYERAGLIDATVVSNVINAIEGIFKSELEKYPEYHRKAQGISVSQYLVPPGFDKLPYEQQRAVVFGIDRIFMEFRETPEEAERRERQENEIRQEAERIARLRAEAQQANNYGQVQSGEEVLLADEEYPPFC